MSKITVTGQITLAGGQLTAKETPPAIPIGPQLWSWGNNASGRLGHGDTVNRSSPVQIGAETNWASISSGYERSHATKTDGSLWAWGRGSEGQLGLGTTGAYSSPVQIGSLTDWSNSISYGNQHTLAVKANNTLWAWGENDFFGQLGLGDLINRSSPTQIGLLSDWASVDGGAAFSAALKTDGTIWTWGNGFSGQFGDGTSGAANYRSSPAQVGSLTTWASFSSGDRHLLAIRTNGELWAWGQGSFGRLGLGDTNDRSSPVQVGGLSDWSIGSAGFRRSHVIKTDGSLWSWGEGANGILGLGNTTNYSSPSQVGSLTDWADIEAGQYHVLAIKTNGTLWTWGKNTAGQHGYGDTINRSSPVQVGSETNWTSISGGREHSLAIKTIV